MEDEREERAVRGPNGKLQVKRVRESCWTARKRGIFLDHLAATGNVTASAAAAGMHKRNAFALRQRDAQFAAEWDAALDTCEARLEAKLIVYSETRGETKSDAKGDEDDELAGFDPKLAMQTLALLRARSVRRQRRRGGPLPKTATREETEAAVLKLLKKLKRRIETR